MFQYFAVFNYEWLPLLLLNQLWQLHGQLRRPTDCYVPSHTWLSSLPGDQKKTIRPFPIRSAKTKWLFGAWNASRDQSPDDQIIQGAVPGRSTRSFLTKPCSPCASTKAPQ